MLSLPNDPNLENFRRQARDLQRAAGAQEPGALELIARLFPKQVDTGVFSLAQAQLVVARSYGFPSWPRLKHYLDEAAALRRNPAADDLTADPAIARSSADQFCLLACLVYSEQDGPDRWASARAVLAAHPAVVTESLAAAAAAADPVAIAARLAADPAAAGRDTGPHRWAPLLYLAYSRAQEDNQPFDRFRESARLLLDAGADPNAGYLWRGLVPPFTVLTGLFGEGEQGAGRQPRHPHSTALARLLLTAGADPNDGQTLYNRMFRPDDSHLELLLEFGLGRGDGGPWRRRFGDALDEPARTLNRTLEWAIDHGFQARVRLLAEHGVDLFAPLTDGRTPAEHAAAAGYPVALQILRNRGAANAPTPELALLGALLSADRAGVAAWMDILPGLRRAQPALVHRVRTAQAVALLAEFGFDLDARRHGSTALHQAAFAGDVELIDALLAGGADAGATDAEFGATPLGWAEYACQPAAVARLGAVTPS